MKITKGSCRCVGSVLIAVSCSLLMGNAGQVETAPAVRSARMEAARDEIGNVRSNIFLTLVQLDRVRGERGPQRPQFSAFTNQLAVTEELCKALARRAQEMRQRGDAYFAEWESRSAAIQNAEERQTAEKRYAERKRSYEAIKEFMADARQNLIAFYEDVISIKALLLGEPNPSSIAQGKRLFNHANWRSIDTQRALMNIENEFDRLAESFSQEVQP